EMRFPAGELDLTPYLRPGHTHVLSLLVLALPLKAMLLSYTDSNSARELKGKVERRGLCGDVFLMSTPSGPRLDDVKVDTSVRRGEITLDAALAGLAAEAHYSLGGQITREGRLVREIVSRSFTVGDLPQGRLIFSEAWKPESLWDVHTPQNKYEV